MTKKPATDWVGRFGREATVPEATAAVAAEAVTQAAPAQSKGTAARVPAQAGVEMVARRRPRVVKHSVSYRLPIDVLTRIDYAIERAADQGETLTQGEAVSRAIRAMYALPEEDA